MSEDSVFQRTSLPNPDIPPPGLTTYDAKDPDTTYPPIVPLRPPAGRAERPARADRRRRLRRVERVRRAVPDAELRAARRRGLKYTRFHTTALCSPTRSALLTGRNHHSVGMGNITEFATSAPGNSSIWPNTAAPLAKIAAAQRLQHRAVRQVPRGAGVGDQPDGSVPPVADRAWASSTSTGSSAARPTSGTRRSTRARHRSSRTGTPEDGYYFNDDLTRPRDQVDPPAEVADAGQAVLRLLRAGRHPRAAPRPEGVGRQVRGPVRPGLGRAARGDVRPAEGARRHPGRLRADRAQRRHPGLGRRRRRDEAVLRPADGGLRGLPREHRPPHRAGPRRPGGPRASSTTRSSTSSSATTAPRPRARSRAPSTR